MLSAPSEAGRVGKTPNAYTLGQWEDDLALSAWLPLFYSDYQECKRRYALLETKINSLRGTSTWPKLVWSGTSVIATKPRTSLPSQHQQSDEDHSLADGSREIVADQNTTNQSGSLLSSPVTSMVLPPGAYKRVTEKDGARHHAGQDRALHPIQEAEE